MLDRRLVDQVQHPSYRRMNWGVKSFDMLLANIIGTSVLMW